MRVCLLASGSKGNAVYIEAGETRLLIDVGLSAREIERRLGLIGVDADSLDAILVTRGGGSMEDLWSFNERVVADAAWNCSIPIVAAIGHESDTTVIELVADVRAATPTH